MRGGGGYRDPLTALRNRVAEKRAALGPREKFLTLVRRAILPPELVREIAIIAERAEQQKASTLDELTEIDRALDQLAEKYDEARALFEPARGPFHPPDSPSPRSHEGSTPGVFERMKPLAIALDGEPVSWATKGALVRFTSQGVPMLLAAHPIDHVDGKVYGLLRAPVPTALPPLAVRLERFTDSILSAIHLRHEVELRIRAFDDVFWIEGDELTARAVLTPDARDALRAMKALDPVLKVWSGTADLEWSGPPAFLFPPGARAAMDAIVSVLATI